MAWINMFVLDAHIWATFTTGVVHRLQSIANASDKPQFTVNSQINHKYRWNTSSIKCFTVEGKNNYGFGQLISTCKGGYTLLQ